MRAGPSPASCHHAHNALERCGHAHYPAPATREGREPSMTANQGSARSKRPTRHVSVGPASAPHRSYYYAMGMTSREIGQPFVGVATTWNEAAPCNIALARQAQVVKKGVKAA